MVPWCVSGLEGLDDDHGPATGGAGLLEGFASVIDLAVRFGLVLRRRDMEQFTGARQVLGAPAIGAQAVVADAVEAWRQDVDKKASDELVGGQSTPAGTAWR